MGGELECSAVYASSQLNGKIRFIQQDGQSNAGGFTHRQPWLSPGGFDLLQQAQR
jgi:hypothetical protein